MMTNRLAACIALVLWAALPAAAGATEPARPATLTVTGSATLSRAPDRAIVSFAIQTTDVDSGTATSANAAIANALTAKLSQLGLPAADVVTTGYGLDYNPRPTKPDPASDQRYGYTVTRTIDASVDAVDRAGAVIDAGVRAGATGVNGISFVLRDAHAAQRAAQAAALADAAAQARSLASAAGVRLVRIVSIAPGGGDVAPRLMRTPVMAMAAAPVPTTIAPGNVTVDSQVTVQYEIAPAP